MPPYGIRFSPSKRGVVGAATYRICANIVGDLLPQGAAVVCGNSCTPVYRRKIR